MKFNSPLISVVMSVYNGEKFLGEAIQSILDQTFQDFEFIIINDGSVDNTLSIIRGFQEKDKRIILINRGNMGLIYSLNEGIEKSKGRYIVRMDADDVSFKNRFKEQIEFMDKDNIDICGSSVQLFNDKGDIKIWRYPTLDQDIKFTLLFTCSFAHPSVMIRKKVFKNLKYKNYKNSEDYKLWTDVALSAFKMGGIDRVLLRYRSHKEQVSYKNSIMQKEQTFKISNFYLSQAKELAIVSNTYKNIRQGVSSEDLYRLYYSINCYRNEKNVSDKYFLKFVRYILNISNSYNLGSFIAYYRITKDLKTNFLHDGFILFLCIFRVDVKSKIYKLLYK
jgi:glycosyltransferase involved in cell wall biosynthesis